ncbi:MAG TPA: MarR family winged helix-turn-helix transcriptional regulator [Hyphomicrobiales bacterium]|nr:MarR family winged helix-turn-helix transcriptional regulator [Hyphomicrobiales bacterium]
MASTARKTARRPAPPASPWDAPGENGAHLAVQDFPTFLLERVSSLARRKLTRRYLEKWRLSLPEWRVLNLVALSSPTSFTAIAQRSTMDKGQISLTLRTLAARGWIDMPPNGAGRRAARTVTVTAAGRAVIAEVLPDARRRQMRLLDRLSAPERRQLHALLRKTAAILEAFDEDEDED